MLLAEGWSIRRCETHPRPGPLVQSHINLYLRVVVPASGDEGQQQHRAQPTPGLTANERFEPAMVLQTLECDSGVIAGVRSRPEYDTIDNREMTELLSNDTPI